MKYLQEEFLSQNANREFLEPFLTKNKGLIEQIPDFISSLPKRPVKEVSKFAKEVESLVKELNNEGFSNDFIIIEDLTESLQKLWKGEDCEDRISIIHEELQTLWKKRIQNWLSLEEFVKIYHRFCSNRHNVEIIEKIDTDFVFKRSTEYFLKNRAIPQLILQLDPNETHKYEDIEEMDEVSARSIEREAFSSVMEEYGIESFRQEFFNYRASGVKEVSLKNKEKGYLVISLTIGRGMTRMFDIGDQFEKDGLQYEVVNVDLSNISNTKNYKIGFLDKEKPAHLKVRVPINIQVYACKMITVP